MKRSAVCVLAFAVLAGGGLTRPACAQGPRADPAAHMATAGMPSSSVMNPADMERLTSASDRKSVKARARARAESIKLARALNLPCELTDAEQVGGGQVMADGRSVELNLYEISCSNGMGYFLESRGPQNPIAVSCFSADATHAADIAQGGKSDFYCQLPANKDVKAMAASLMSTAGTACAINTLRWFGMSDSGQMEYSEVSCADNNGYLLETPRVGPSAQTSVVSCQDAAKRGLKCRLTAVGSASTQVTMQMFRDAIKQNGLACEPTKMRVIGRESVDKRYVVELQCAQQTDGLVAFIPLEGNTNKFETLDCAAAAGRDIVCQLTGR